MLFTLDTFYKIKFYQENVSNLPNFDHSGLDLGPSMTCLHPRNLKAGNRYVINRKGNNLVFEKTCFDNLQYNWPKIVSHLICMVMAPLMETWETPNSH